MSSGRSLDHVIRTPQQRRRDRQPEDARSLQVDVSGDREQAEAGGRISYGPRRLGPATYPLATGSGTSMKTMGIVLVALMAACTAAFDTASMTYLQGDQLAASSGRRSYFPSAHRYSIAMVPPFHVAELSQPLAEGVIEAGELGGATRER
jgi:hypothetical protein